MLEQATLETEKRYYKLAEGEGVRVRKQEIAGYPEDSYTEPNEYVHRLNADGTKMVSRIVLKVMSGDRVNIRASSCAGKAAHLNHRHRL